MRSSERMDSYFSSDAFAADVAFAARLVLVFFSDPCGPLFFFSSPLENGGLAMRLTIVTLGRLCIDTT